MAVTFLTFYRTRCLDQITQQQEFFGNRGLTGIGVTNNSEGAALGHFVLNGSLRHE